MRNAGRDRVCQNSCSNVQNPARSAAHQTGWCLHNLLMAWKASCYRLATHAICDPHFSTSRNLCETKFTSILFLKLLNTTFFLEHCFIAKPSYPLIPTVTSPWCCLYSSVFLHTPQASGNTRLICQHGQIVFIRPFSFTGCFHLKIDWTLYVALVSHFLSDVISIVQLQ